MDRLLVTPQSSYSCLCFKSHNNTHARLSSTYVANNKNIRNCLLERESEQSVHLNPLTTTFLQVSINHSLDALKPFLVRLGQYHNSVLGVGVFLLRSCLVLRLLGIKQCGKIQKLIVKLLLGIFKDIRPRQPSALPLGPRHRWP